MRRTIYLRERKSYLLKLYRTDMDFLLQQSLPCFEVRATHQKHRYQIITKGYVGVVLTPNFRFVLRPKIPIPNFGYLLDPRSLEFSQIDESQIGSSFSYFDWLTQRFAEELAYRSLQGLQRGYVQQEEQQPFLQGRLDLTKQLQQGPAGQDRFHCEYVEFTQNCLWNRIPKTIAETLLQSDLLIPETRQTILQALPAFAEVEAIRLSADIFANCLLNPQTECYRPLLDRCQQLFWGWESSLHLGQHYFAAYLLNLEQVFERFLARELASLNSDNVQLRVQESIRISTTKGKAPLLFRPDFILTQQGQARTILDAKWKKGSNPEPSDIQQILAYGSLLNCTDVRLIYLGSQTRYKRYRLPNQTNLTLQTVQLSGSGKKLKESLQRLKHSLV